MGYLEWGLPAVSEDSAALAPQETAGREPRRPLVVLLHALGCHNGWWTEVGSDLGEEFHVIAPDLRGHGTAGPAEGYGWDAYAGDVEALIERFAADSSAPVAIVGHSMGGYVGLAVAARGRVELGALVILDMKTSASDEELTQMRAAAERPARPFASLAEAVARYRLSPPEDLPAVSEDRAILAPQETAGRRVAPERLASVAADSFTATDGAPWLPRFDRRAMAIEPLAAPALAGAVRCPSLWVRGEHSLVMDRSGAEALAAAAHGQFLELAGLHHHLPLAAPELVSQVVGRFLRSTLSH